MSRDSTTGVDAQHSCTRTLTALLGAPLLATLLSLTLTAFLPLDEPTRVAVGEHTLVPVWVLLSCILPLQASGRRALRLCSLLSLPLAAALLLRAWTAP